MAAATLAAGLAGAPGIGDAAPIVITHKKAIEGGVTKGDKPGYPVTLSKSGSYVLGSNLDVPKNKIGIDVTDHDVTIDGAGFRIHGGFNGNIGIRTKFNALTVTNLMIVWFKNAGIEAEDGDSLTVDNVRILVNGWHGVRTRDFARIRNSNISLNGGQGVSCGQSCLVENSVLSQNHMNGVYLKTGNVRGSVLRGNEVFGVYGTDLAGAVDNVIVDNGQPTAIGGNAASYGPNLCRPGCGGL